jgi:hypothetical protein
MASITTRTKTLKDGRKVKRHRAVYRDATGRQVAKLFGPGTGNGDAKRDAQAWLDAQVHARLSGTAVDRRAGRQAFGEPGRNPARPPAESSILAHRRHQRASLTRSTPNLTTSFRGTHVSSTQRHGTRSQKTGGRSSE